MIRTVFAASFAVFASMQAAAAHEFKSGDISIDHPVAYETAPSAMSGGGYMTITNSGTAADRLLEVQADFPKVMIHESLENDGVATMEHREFIEIPAGATVALQPGGYHVMFMGLDGDPFEVGEKIPATLIFETAGSIPVEFNVEARDGQSATHTGHGAMAH